VILIPIHDGCLIAEFLAQVFGYPPAQFLFDIIVIPYLVCSQPDQ
jgi:hypothetical protein